MKTIIKYFIFLILTMLTYLSYAQSTSPGNTASNFLEYLGWNGSGGNNKHLDIKNLFSPTITNKYNINFWTNNGTTTTQKMTILGTNGNDDGYVGIGIASPLFKLDVDYGHINVTNPYYGFCIGGGGSPLVHNEVLKYHGAAGYTPSTTNIFVGVGAGIINQANVGLSTGLNNTFVGNDAGVVNTDGYSNTFIGYRAGFGNTLGRYNTLVGDQAGNSIQCRYFNTFVGYQAGFSAGNYSTPSSEPGGTFVGNVSGYNTINEIGNSFFGDHSGFNNETGTGNTYIGAYSMADYGANNSDNIYSTALGAHTRIKGNFSTTLGAFSRVEGDRSTAIGQHAFANHEDIIIIGDNYVNVGIGLSCDIINISPPATTLELNAIIGNNFANIDDIPGASGLRFRDLTIFSTPVLTNPNSNVLSVNEDGDVILVPNTGVFGFGTCSPYAPTILTTSDAILDLSSNNLYFKGQYSGEKSNVAIGLGCEYPLMSKLTVYQTKTTNGTVGDISCAGIFVSDPDLNICDISIGTWGMARHGGKYNVGLYGLTSSNGQNPDSYGVLGLSNPIPTPITGTTNSWAGYFNGAVFATYDFFSPSDSILKTGTTPMSKGLEIIDSLKPKTFYFDTAFANAKGLYLPGNKQYGFLAQDVQQILPEFITEVTNPPQFDTAGNEIHPAFTFKALNYNGFIGILTQGIKDLDSISDNQASRIDTLEVYGRGDFDWLLSGSNDQLRTPSDINEIKYTNGYLQVNRNNTTSSAVLDVRNDTSIAHFIDTIGAGMFATDMTGFNIPAYSTFSNLTSNIYNLPNVSANIVGINSRITSNTGNNSTSILSEIDGPGSSNTAISGIAKGAGNNCGIVGGAETTDENVIGYGIRGYSYTESTYSCPWSFNWGVSGGASGGFYNEGGEFSAGGVDWNCSNTTGMNIGVFCQASNASYNYGIWASAPIIAGHQHSSVAGYFNGNVDYTGTLAHVSDMKFKQNIMNLPNATSIIEQLQPRTYTYKIADYPYINFDQGKQYGFVAQEMALILPDLVSSSVFRAEYDSDQHMIHDTVGYKSVNYMGLIPIMVQAMKETNHKTDSLTQTFTNKIDSLNQIIKNYENRFNNLEQMINACCVSHTNKSVENPNGGNVTEINLENIQAIVLDQNVPNPFAESTFINYFIPENINFAQIIFTDNYGRIMKTVDITLSGNGMIKVYASNLSSGIYTYSLVVDGKVVETKKMMRTK